MTDEVTETPKETVKADPKDSSEVLSVKAQKRYEDDILKWKSEYKVTNEELETIKAKADSEKQELASKVENASKEKNVFEQKYIDAELKAQAVAAGIKDIDLVKLIDKKDIKLDENGNVTGIDTAITEFKTKKPDWFGSEKKVSTSSGSTLPDKTGVKPLDARTMSKEEWARNRQNAMAGRF